MRYLTPTSLAEATEALATGAFTILAGGTDVYPALRDRPVRADILDITRIADLRGITRHPEGGWRIGATTTWTDITRATLPACFDGLKLAAREVGSIQVQNAGTVAGNICNASPAADGVPPLLALDAVVELASAGGQRRIPLAEFITGVRRTARRTEELVTAVLIPDQPDTAKANFLKLGARRYLVISIAMAAAVVVSDPDGRIAQARVAVGACSPVAQRLPALEQALIGTPAADAATRVQADQLAPLAPIDDIRGSGAYRLDAVIALLRRLLDATPAEIAA